MTVGDCQPGDVVRLADESAWRIEWVCHGGGCFARRWNAVAWHLAGVGGDTAHVYLAGHVEVVSRAKGGRRPKAVKGAA